MQYGLNCPNCGKLLQLMPGAADSAPWACMTNAGGCGRSWWRSELSAAGRDTWDRYTKSHVHVQGHPLVATRDREVEFHQRLGLNAVPGEVIYLDDAGRTSFMSLMGLSALSAANQDRIVGLFRNHELGRASADDLRAAFAPLGVRANAILARWIHAREIA